MTSIAVEGAIDGSTGSQTSRVVCDPGIPPPEDPRDVRQCRITVDFHRIKALPMVPVTFRFGDKSMSFIRTKAVHKFGLLVTDAEVRKKWPTGLVGCLIWFSRQNWA